jgi:hypothetical protein
LITSYDTAGAPAVIDLPEMPDALAVERARISGMANMKNYALVFGLLAMTATAQQAAPATAMPKRTGTPLGDS